MQKYSKAIGSVIGAAVTVGAVLGLDLSWMQAPAVTEVLVMLGGLIGTYFAPKNAE